MLYTELAHCPESLLTPTYISLPYVTNYSNRAVFIDLMFNT